VLDAGSVVTADAPERPDGATVAGDLVVLARGRTRPL
jgi:hypothetical protein